MPSKKANDFVDSVMLKINWYFTLGRYPNTPDEVEHIVRAAMALAFDETIKPLIERDIKGCKRRLAIYKSKDLNEWQIESKEMMEAWLKDWCDDQG